MHASLTQFIGGVACMVNGRYLGLSTFQYEADVSVWRVTVCGEGQYVCM